MQSSTPVIVVIDDYEGRVASLAALQRLRAALPAADIRVLCAQPLDAAATESLRDVEYLVLIRERTRITEALLDRLPSLKALVQTGTAGQPATSHIDLAACARRGIAVLEGGASDGHSAAEVAWALILASRRQLCGYVQSMQRGEWQRGNNAPALARSLRGDTFGILGFGRIGQLLGSTQVVPAGEVAAGPSGDDNADAGVGDGPVHGAVVLIEQPPRLGVPVAGPVEGYPGDWAIGAVEDVCRFHEGLPGRVVWPECTSGVDVGNSSRVEFNT